MSSFTRAGFILPFLLVLPQVALAQVKVKKSVSGTTYSIRVPAEYEPGKGLLVIGLHGGGDEHSNFIKFLDQVPSLKQHAVVAPNAIKDKQFDNPDFNPIGGMIKELQESLRPGRTIVFGFSRGAFFGCALGLKFPDRIDAIVMHSGGLPMPQVPPGDRKKLAYYLIHGAKDDKVPVDKSRQAAKMLRESGIPLVLLEEVPDLLHKIDMAAVERGLAWVETTLGSVVKKLTPAEAGKAVNALEKALEGKAWGEAAEIFPTLAGVTSGQAKIAKLAAKGIKSGHEELVMASIAASGRCSSFGVANLKKISSKDEAKAEAAAIALGRTGSDDAIKPLVKLTKSKLDTVAIAAAKGLGALGSDKAKAELQKALKKTGKSKKKAARREAIEAVLKGLGG